VSVAVLPEQARRHIAFEARAELARRSLLDFCRQMFPKWLDAPHLNLIADRLEDIECGRIKRLAFSLPPGSGKSTLLQLFGAWYIARDPRRKVITASAGAELAERNSRGTRGLFFEDAWPFEAKLSADSTAQHRWSTTAGGGFFAIGSGGGVTGWRCDLLCVDDAQNGAGSDSERASLWEWFSTILRPRLEPSGSIIVIGTRWCEDDLIGRILASAEASSWTVINLPAIAGENDPELGRKPGEALWPQRYPLEELNRTKIAMGSRAFNCQFQGDAMPADGSLFKREWMQRRHSTLPTMKRAAIFADGAWKTGTGADRTAFALWGTDGIDYYLIDAWAARVEYPDGRTKFIDFWNRWKNVAPTVYPCVEDAASGIPLIQELRRITDIPIIGVPVDKSKIVRAEATTPIFESGKISLPANAAWLDEWIEEHLRFPAGRHDDYVDTTSGALAKLLQPASSLRWGKLSTLRGTGMRVQHG